jgi:FtsP/CotA-like multicopper oxidase with cupredoxin domain
MWVISPMSVPDRRAVLRSGLAVAALAVGAAANPGQWMTHCHNLYHAPQGGMMAMLSYQT